VPIPIVVLTGDQTGQELLDEALRVVARSVTGLDLHLVRFDLGLGGRDGSRDVHRIYGRSHPAGPKLAL
jgi:hypothetical protein